MIRGLPASLLLHAAVIGAGYLAWPYVGTSAVDEEFLIVPVDLVDVGEMTNVAPVTEPEEEVEEPEEEPEPTPPEPEEEESEAPVEEQPDERDLPEDDVSTASEAAPPEPEEEDVVPDLDEAPEEEPEPEPEEEPELPEPEPENPNPQEKDNPLDSLLNDADSTFESERQTKKKTQPPKQPERELLKETPPAQEPRRGAGERTGNTVRIEQLLYNQVYPCWDGVSDQPEPERLNVQLKAEFDAEGNLTNLDLVQPRRSPIGDRAMSLAIERAMRAVRKCQPYRLPKDDYELWKVANINLGPAFSED